MRNLTNKITATYTDEATPFHGGTCPICGGRNTEQTDIEDGDALGGTVLVHMECYNCGSTFIHTFWIRSTLVTQDGRFETVGY